MKKLAKQYDPFTVEARWEKRWVEEPFASDATSHKPPFCIVMPPPNVSGNLHLGHAFDNTIIDTLIRFKRMQGYEALYQPGTDHAGITTQVQVEKALRDEGLSRHDLGREAFLKHVWAWKEKYGSIILAQLQRLGISADWSRTRFTMDAGLSKAVRKQFVELYHQGLIYRSERIVNWDPVSQTVLSDLEVDREERLGKLYTLAYELQEGGSIKIATVRPETIFADVALAVHPEDERYKHLVGKRARIPLTDRWVPIITDTAVEMNFGTGALKITPAHDPLDFEIGERHNLPRPSVIDLHAKLTSALVLEPFRGLDRFEARKDVVKALVEDGAFCESKDYTISMGFSQRTQEPVEPILSLQWFYNTDKISGLILKALDEGDIELFPERYTKVNCDWLLHLRHWCISRQLWWGHQIPAWYDQEGNVYVPDIDDPYTDCPDNPQYADIDLAQDPDVFDTWFSSNLWPFSTLGWPDTSDPFYKKFYPTNVLVTGYDILFFWVARMEIAGYECTGKRPFEHVLLHGLVLDERGQKMSKSKGNGIDPLDIIAQSGSDALRFAMTYVSTGGQDIRWDSRRVEMGRHFNNKLWNAARFVIMNLEGDLAAGQPEMLADRWIMSRLQRIVNEVTQHLELYDLGKANRALYDFVWSEFCDWYLEAVKPQLREGNARTRHVLQTVFTSILKLLHPLIPFISSELYDALGYESQIGWDTWPQVDASLIDEEAEESFEHLKNGIVAVRNLRSEADLAPTKVIPLHVQGNAQPVIEANKKVFELLARVKLHGTISGMSLSQVVPDLEIRLPIEGIIDVDDWKLRQEKRLKEFQDNKHKIENKLRNPKFVKHAPYEVVVEERRRLDETNDLIGKLEMSLAKLA